VFPVRKFYTANVCFSAQAISQPCGPGVSNTRPEGRMWAPRAFCAAQERIQPVTLGGAISVIFGSQVS